MTHASLDAHRSALARYARRLLDPGLAHRVDLSGVVQQTLFDASRATPSPGKPEGHWLRTLLRRNYLDAVRRERAGRRDGRRDRPLPGVEAAAPGDTPSRRAVAVEQLVALLAGVDALPPDQREAVRHRYLDGLGLDEIARRSGKSRAAVAGLLRRGLETLRGRLDP